LPLPLPPERTVIQLASEVAVHGQLAPDARTAIVPEPPAVEKLSDVSPSDIVQAAAAWVTLARWSFSSMTPRRVAASLLGLTAYSIAPSP